MNFTHPIFQLLGLSEHKTSRHFHGWKGHGLTRDQRRAKRKAQRAARKLTRRAA